MNVLELSHADPKHNSLQKGEFMGNKVKCHSRVKAGCKPVRTDAGAPVEEIAGGTCRCLPR